MVPYIHFIDATVQCLIYLGSVAQTVPKMLSAEHVLRGLEPKAVLGESWIEGSFAKLTL